MNLRSQQIMNMAGACLGVAFHADYKPAWLNQQPLALGTELAEAERLYRSVIDLSAQAKAAAGGAAAAKAFARTEVEDKAFVMARALSFHFKRCGDFDRLGRVNLSRTHLRRLRQQELLHMVIAIRDLAQETLDEPAAASRGITPAH